MSKCKICEEEIKGDVNCHECNMKFEILNIQKEKSLNGYTYIRAKSIIDSVIVNIKIKNNRSHDKKHIKDMLILEYRNITKPIKNDIKVGVII